MNIIYRVAEIRDGEVIITFGLTDELVRIRRTHRGLSAMYPERLLVIQKSRGGNEWTALYRFRANGLSSH